MRTNEVVSASEIGSWVSYPEAWRLQALGLQPGNEEALDAGERQHGETAALEVQSGIALSLGRWLIAAAVLVLVVLVSVGTGAVQISPTEVVSILARRIGLDLPWAFEPQQEAVLLAIRLPRVTMGILIGAGLGVSGAAIQGLFRNPLADPGLTGISSGAAVTLPPATTKPKPGTPCTHLFEDEMTNSAPISSMDMGIPPNEDIASRM